ncbi:MAG: nodulation protein NfeD, partial [candidate division Zixibacteria bacterium]|nr:nodulation protein NfeD [candidate division Zixibacteria bacterium]
MKVLQIKIISLIAIVLFFGAIYSYADSESDSTDIQTTQALVKIVTIDSPIGPVTERIIKRSIETSEEDFADALIIEMNTPGGLDTSMRHIIQGILKTNVPVIVYVSPSGSRAASAGVFISYAAHIAAMAPGTNIGAAHPVNLGGKMDSTMSEKVANDAAAYIRSLAESRGRNVQWAEDAVYKSVSVTEKEALEQNIIDIVAVDIKDLLKQCDGWEIKINEKTTTLNLTNVKTERVDITFADEILKIISDPNIAYILMSLGMLGLYFEFSNPGAVFPGVVGAICLILAFFSFSTLPINYAGLLLIIAATIMFLLEIKIVSHGALTIGGIITMVIGSMMLIDTDVPYMRISMVLILTVVFATAAFFA